MKIILLRGPSAVGKSTIAKGLLSKLKTSGKNVGYIREDDFRKQMQYKYKAADKEVHINSVKLIQVIIKKLISIDKYDLLILEGLFRYNKQLDSYKSFCKKNKIKLKIFQLNAPIKEREKRANKSNLKTSHGRGDIESIPIKGGIVINTTKSVNRSVNNIISKI